MKVFKRILQALNDWTRVTIVIVAAVVLAACLEVGCNAARYMGRQGFDAKRAWEWSVYDWQEKSEKLTSYFKAKEYHGETELLYNVNKYIEIVPCVNLKVTGP